MDYLLQATPVTTCRLITINDYERDEEGNTLFYRILPAGDSVAVPERLVETEFVQALLKEGVLINHGPVAEELNDGDVPMDELRKQAVKLGIQPSDRWSRAKLQSEIDKLA